MIARCMVSTSTEEKGERIPGRLKAVGILGLVLTNE
jgi:hypothetical protein